MNQQVWWRLWWEDNCCHRAAVSQVESGCGTRWETSVWCETSRGTFGKNVTRKLRTNTSRCGWVGQADVFNFHTTTQILGYQRTRGAHVTCLRLRARLLAKTFSVKRLSAGAWLTWMFLWWTFLVISGQHTCNLFRRGSHQMNRALRPCVFKSMGAAQHMTTCVAHGTVTCVSLRAQRLTHLV